MLKSRFLYFIVAVLGSSMFSKAQNEKLDLILNKYRQVNQWSVSTKTKIFKNSTDIKPVRIIEASSLISPQGSITKNGSFEVLRNERCVFIIDYAEKTAQYSRSNHKAFKENMEKQKPEILALEDSVDASRNVIVSELTNGQLMVQISNNTENSELVKSEFYFNQPSLELHKVIYWFNESAQYSMVSIEYLTFEFNPHFSTDMFSESKFLKGSGKTAVLLPKYKEFELYNQYDKSFKDYFYAE